MKIYTATFDTASPTPNKFWVPQNSQFAIGVKVLSNGEETGGTVTMTKNGETVQAEENKVGGFTIFNVSSGGTGAVEYAIVDSTKSDQTMKLIQVVTDSTVFEVGGSGGTVDVSNKVDLSSLAPDFSEAEYYDVNNTVNKDGKLYICTGYSEPGTWESRASSFTELSSGFVTCEGGIMTGSLRINSEGAADYGGIMLRGNAGEVAEIQIGIDGGGIIGEFNTTQGLSAINFKSDRAEEGSKLVIDNTPVVTEGTLSNLVADKRDIDDLSYNGIGYPTGETGYFTLTVDGNNYTLPYGRGYNGWLVEGGEIIVFETGKNLYCLEVSGGDFFESIYFSLDADCSATVVGNESGKTYVLKGFNSSTICSKNIFDTTAVKIPKNKCLVLGNDGSIDLETLLSAYEPFSTVYCEAANSTATGFMLALPLLQNSFEFRDITLITHGGS